MPSLIDVVIGTVFVLLLFSLVVSTINELILSLLDQRAQFLQLGLRELLSGATNNAGQPGEQGGGLGRIRKAVAQIKRAFFIKVAPGDGVRDLCSHGLLNAFSRTDGGNFPSYIPSGAFVIALFDLISHKWSNQAGEQDFKRALVIDDLAASIQALPDSQLREALLSILASTGRDFEAFQIAVEGWFNSTMDRVSGWYKRFTQKWMILIGFFLAVIFNVDTIRIVQALSSNPDLRKAIVEQAAKYSKTANDQTGATGKSDTSSAPASQRPVASPASKELARAIDDYREALEKLSGTGIPIGWNEAQLASLGLLGEPLLDAVPKNPRLLLGWAYHHSVQLLMLLAGWLITALAASLGAPFWFDLLGRFINVRNAGKVPGENSPTQPAGATIVTLDRTPTAR